MDNAKSRLDTLTIASPCSVSWESMTGDERVRACARCRLNVYNLSAMTRPEAERFIEKTEGRACVRFYRRADGTVITRDCPVGLRAARLKLMRLAGAAAAMVAVLAAGLGLRRRPAVGQPRAMGEPRHTMGEMAPMTAVIGGIRPTMGKPAPRDAQ